jgi:hypothetical protein
MSLSVRSILSIIQPALFAIPALFLGEAMAGPNLLVNPVRLVFDKAQLSAPIDLNNTGDQSGTYRISIVNKRMDADGKFSNVITEPAAGELFADKLIQFAPRQPKVLGPGAGQVVRVFIKKPADLAPGEYRSHLVFERIPDPKTLGAENEKLNAPTGKELGVVLTPLIGISIPIIVRHGETSVTSTIKGLSFQPEKDKNPAILVGKLERSGNQSSYGDITVSVSINGAEKNISTMSGFAVYTPNTYRNLKLVLRPEAGIDLNKKKLRVVYREAGNPEGKILAEETLQLP